MSSVIETAQPKMGSLREEYEDLGFIVLRNVFDEGEVARMVKESDRLLRECSHLINPNNLRCRYMPHYQTGTPLFEVFDPVNDISPVCKAITTDPRIVSVVESLYGEPACLFKEKLIFKPAGATGYPLHQDIPLCWDGFPKSFLTVLIAIDPTSEENGCTEVFSGYHRDFLSKDPCTYMLPDDAVDAARGTELVLEPGDVAIFHGLTPHKSAPNQSGSMRRVFYVSYNALSDGGDQRETHYAEFREKLRQYRKSTTSEPAYFA